MSVMQEKGAGTEVTDNWFDWIQNTGCNNSDSKYTEYTSVYLQNKNNTGDDNTNVWGVVFNIL